jgi:hypothetical protein
MSMCKDLSKSTFETTRSFSAPPLHIAAENIQKSDFEPLKAYKFPKNYSILIIL